MTETGRPWEHDARAAVHRDRLDPGVRDRERRRALRHVLRTADRGGRVRSRGPTVGPERDLGVQQRDERLEVTAAGRREEGVDPVRRRAGSVSTSAGRTACTRPRARLASSRVASGVRPRISAISRNGIPNESWSTKARRSGGARLSRTRWSARPTCSASTASSAGCGSWSARTWRSGPERGEAGPRDGPGHPPVEVVDGRDVRGARPAEAHPGVLDGVLRVRAAAEDPLGQCGQPGPVLLEAPVEFCCGSHRSRPRVAGCQSVWHACRRDRARRTTWRPRPHPSPRPGDGGWRCWRCAWRGSWSSSTSPSSPSASRRSSRRSGRIPVRWSGSAAGTPSGWLRWSRGWARSVTGSATARPAGWSRRRRRLLRGSGAGARPGRAGGRASARARVAQPSWRSPSRC